MKQLILLPVLGIGAMAAHLPTSNANPFVNYSLYSATANNGPLKTLQLEPGSTRMQAAVFKAQEYCRAEVKDFEWEVKFTIVSATVYFTGANFTNMVKTTINSSSLKPIKEYMNRCTPGSVIIFDEVKVKGPDNAIRTIAGASIMLY